MHHSKIIFLVDDGVKAIQAQYEPRGKIETFKTLMPNVAVGDIVVVESDTRFNFTTVKVTEVDCEPDMESPLPVKWALTRLDMGAVKELRGREATVVAKVQQAERQRRKQQLRETMLAGLTTDALTLEAQPVSEPPDEGEDEIDY